MSISNGIQHPENFYNDGISWKGYFPTAYSWFNLWSANNATTGHNDNPVVKTIYDPCPAGFEMPASNAFTGFTTNGQDNGTPNIYGTWIQWYGYAFNNKITDPDALIYFPAPGLRNHGTGLVSDEGNIACYWLAVPTGTWSACCMDIYFGGGVQPLSDFYRARGVCVRPVADN